MKVEFHVKEIVISAKQKALIEKKLLKLKRYLKDEPMMIDVFLRDETSSEKGGVDQAVELSAVFGKEKIFIREVDDRLMRAFAYAFDSLERNMRRYHQKRVDDSHRPGGRVEKVLKALKIKR